MSTLRDTHLETRTRLQPWHTNAIGTAHGGKLVVLLDDIATLSASRHTGTTCVTAAIERVQFHDALEAGDTLFADAYVFQAGSTSVSVHTRGFIENPHTGDTSLGVDAQFVFVAIDEDGETVPVPSLSVETDRGSELRALALGTTDE